MADRFYGIPWGTIGTDSEVATGTSTTSKAIELRYTTGIGITKRDVQDAVLKLLKFMRDDTTNVSETPC